MTPISIVAAEENHSILIPPTYDILWSAVCFALIFFGFMKLIVPRFRSILNERAEAIEGGIKKAERMQAEADAALEEYQKQLAEGRAEAARLRAEAHDEGKAIIAEMKQQAHEESERIISQAKAQIEAEKSAAQVELRGELGRLSTELAGRIIGESLADDAKAAEVVDRFIADLEAQSAKAQTADTSQSVGTP